MDECSLTPQEAQLLRIPLRKQTHEQLEQYVSCVRTCSAAASHPAINNSSC